MCFSFEVSIGTFLFSWISSLFLLTKKLKKEDQQSIIFLMIFSSMQLADAILWYIKLKKNSINYYVTSILVPFIISLQLLYRTYVMNDEKSIFIKISVICLIIYLFYRFNGYSRFSLCNGYFSSPIWGGKEVNLLELLIASFFILYSSWKALAFTWLILFPFMHLISNGGYGSLWCAIAALFSIYNLYIYR